MAIYIRPADTQPGLTLMGLILPSSINYRAGSGSDFIHTWPEPDPFKGKNTKIPPYIYKS